MIIGISGKAGSGKDTVGNYLINRRVVDRNVSFATYLKQMCSDLFNIPLEDTYTHEGKEAFTNIEVTDKLVQMIPSLKYKKGDYLKIREVLQFIGTEIMRHIDYDCWVNALFNNIKDDENVVITDLRFPNEAKRIRESGGLLIRLTRGSTNMTHYSEVALDDWTDWDIVYDNSNEDVKTTLENITRLIEIKMGYYV